MKTTEIKPSSSPHLHQSGQPFFQKGGDSSFFSDSQTDLQTMPFFNKQAVHPIIQTKLTIGQPGDKYEQEADAMADQVVQRLSNSETIQTKSLSLASTVTPVIQPKCSGCEEEEQVQKKEEDDDRLESVLLRKSIFESDEPPPEEEIQLKCAECEIEEKVQRSRKTDAPVNGGSSSLENRLNSARGSGSPLPEETRSQMESSFGSDFSNVRIHTGTYAVQMNKELHSQAFTHGSDIYFNSGKYNPESTEGKKLLAHELTHTVQQGHSNIQSKKQDNASEQMFLSTGKNVVQGFDIPFTDYETDFSLRGVKTAAGLGVDAVKWTGGKVVEGGEAVYKGGKWVVDKGKDAFMWIYRKIKKLINKGISWIKNKWNSLENFASGGFNAIKNIFKWILQFIKNPFSLIAGAIMNMDAEQLQNSWSKLTGSVLNIWDGFHKIGVGLVNKAEKLWNTISGYATGLFDNIDSLTNHWAFKKLPSSIQNIVYGLIDTLRSLWNKVKSGWDFIIKKIRTFIDKAFEAIRNFVKNVLSFAIDTIINGIILFGKVLMFIMDFLKNPMKYIRPLSEQIAGYLNGVEVHFQGQISKYFGDGSNALSATAGLDMTDTSTASTVTATSDVATSVIQKKDDTSITSANLDSASWSEIGSSVLDMMNKKWVEVKKDPLSIVLTILRDMVLPVIGNVKDVIKLFEDIKKIVMRPFRASSLKDFWTSILRLLDIPILLYNTFWSIIGRTLALPLLIASFIPHPIVKGIAIAAGYALLAALIAGESANIGHKLLLLKTGKTSDNEKKHAFNSLSDSLIAFAMEVALAIFILVVSSIANVIKGVFSFVKGKVIKPKVTSKPSGKGKVDVDAGSSGKKGDLTDTGKKKTKEELESTLETTKGKNGKDLTPEEVKAEIDSFENGTLRKSTDPEYEWEIELQNGHKWRRKKNGKWCRFTTKHCFDEDGEVDVGEVSDREIYDMLKEEGLIDKSTSFEEFLGTKPGGPAPGTDISADVKNGIEIKPTSGYWKQAPNWKKWVTERGGKIIKHGDGSVTYINKDGKWVKYSADGYPDFSNHLSHPEVKSVDIEPPFHKDRTPDYRKANEKAGKEKEWGDRAPDGYTWHHHENGTTMQLVPELIHDLFGHAGGIANL